MTWVATTIFNPTHPKIVEETLTTCMLKSDAESAGSQTKHSSITISMQKTLYQSVQCIKSFVIYIWF